MKIKIIKTPPGEVPEWVRRQWIGLQFVIMDREVAGIQAKVLGGCPQNNGGYHVNAVEAIKILSLAARTPCAPAQG